MYTLDESLWPLVVVQRSDTTTDKEMESILQSLSKLIKRREPYVLVIDFSRSRPLTHTQRMMLAEHQTQTADLARDYCKGFFVVINSATARLARAVTSFVRPSTDQHEVVASLDEALERAAIRFEQAGVHMGAFIARTQALRQKSSPATSGAGARHD
ncbi:hypothetical protein D7Y13_25970 [Corallococcus praedator]|uniref:STAS domain-containing protein n=1 Tax=Corallococcus praedator TaxID=2316724 RepID=A0ABX9QEA9_9BACT|nr:MULTISPECIES: hypothetical protein [Corallococcus]RKH09425.1 hypothetical protein D7X74_29610 [Corallococcus sp. CA047B]RKH24755.1 hypothetical protein D7X75_31405 [Corallococcus sp. CA031C]RKI00913.1 hypothetical protein D7Y13_25970 [Corallococcus praedator]